MVRAFESAAAVVVVLAIVHEDVLDRSAVGLAQQLGASVADTEHEVAFACAIELLDAGEPRGLECAHRLVHPLAIRRADDDQSHLKGLFEAGRQAFGYAELHDLIDRRLPDRLHRTEVSQERALARGTDPFDGVEWRSERLARPDLAVMGDRETVRLIANALDEEHARRVPLLHDRLGSARREDLLALLRQGEGR